jgi:predicted aldo/keto reductase-like oxidoreductase
MNRRDFIGSSTAGLAGLIYYSGRKRIPGISSKERKLIFRTLGKTGIRVPVVGMGILVSGNPDLMRAAIDAGITHFDTTADPLQQEHNEAMIGEVLRGRPRESFVFGPKIHLPRNLTTGLYERRATEEEFTRKLDASLKRLKMEYVDVLYHHDVWKKESALHEPVMKAMDKAKRAGKTRFLGLTTHMNVAEAVRAAADSDFYDVVMAAYNFRQKDQLRIREAIAHASSAGVGVIAIKVIRGDLEAGEKPINPKASLKWVLQDAHVHATIPGFTTFEEMNVDLSVMDDLDLADDEREDLKRAASMPGLYCQGCGRCLEECPARLPIPDLMRAYMYAYGYRRPALAQSLVTSLDLPPQPCEGCSSCRIDCLNQWNVGEKVRDITRLRDMSSMDRV